MPTAEVPGVSSNCMRSTALGSFWAPIIMDGIYKNTIIINRPLAKSVNRQGVSWREVKTLKKNTDKFTYPAHSSDSRPTYRHIYELYLLSAALVALQSLWMWLNPPTCSVHAGRPCAQQQQGSITLASEHDSNQVSQQHTNKQKALRCEGAAGGRRKDTIEKCGAEGQKKVKLLK